MRRSGEETPRWARVKKIGKDVWRMPLLTGMSIRVKWRPSFTAPYFSEEVEWTLHQEPGALGFHPSLPLTLSGEAPSPFWTSAYPCTERREESHPFCNSFISSLADSDKAKVLLMPFSSWNVLNSCELGNATILVSNLFIGIAHPLT